MCLPNTQTSIDRARDDQSHRNIPECAVVLTKLAGFCPTYIVEDLFPIEICVTIANIIGIELPEEIYDKKHERSFQ